MTKLIIKGTSEEVLGKVVVESSLEIEGKKQELIDILAASMLDEPSLLHAVKEALKITKQNKKN